MFLQSFSNIVGHTNIESALSRVCRKVNIILMLLHTLIKYNPTICHFERSEKSFFLRSLTFIRDDSCVCCHFDHFDYSQCRLREKSRSLTAPSLELTLSKANSLSV